VKFAHHGDDQAGVDAAGEESADGDVRDEPLADGFFQQSADLVADPRLATPADSLCGQADFFLDAVVPADADAVA
jgi:hypothetical protein